MPSNTNAAMRSIRTAITRFDYAAQNYAFIGAAHPEAREEIEDEYLHSRELLEKLIERKLNE